MNTQVRFGTRADGTADRPHLQRGIDAARASLLGLQDAGGHWIFQLEADCTIPAEYILMMHYLDEIDAALEARSPGTCARIRLRTAAGPCTTAASST